MIGMRKTPESVESGTEGRGREIIESMSMLDFTGPFGMMSG